MYEIYGDNVEAKFVDVGKTDERAGGVVVVGGLWVVLTSSIDIVVKRPENFGGLESRHIEEAAPDIRRREATGGEVRNDAKVVRAALQCTPEVGMF